MKRFMFILILIFSQSLLYADEDIKEYWPYPILFVHGIKPGNAGSWSTTKKAIGGEYFRYMGGYKYFHTNDNQYFPLFNYDGNGDINKIARDFGDIVRQSINSFPADYPESGKKIIVVAHSMGGLVVRSLLTQNASYRNEIAKVVFIGIPHKGASIASTMWTFYNVGDLLKKMVNEKFNFYGLFAGVVPYYGYLSYNPPTVQLGLATRIYGSLRKKMEADIGKIEQVKKDIYLIFVKFLGGEPPRFDSKAIQQLNLTGTTFFNKIYIGDGMIEPPHLQSANINITTIGSETFLSKTNLSVPEKYRVIKGSGNIPDGTGIRLINDWINNNFQGCVNLPSRSSLIDAISTGDSIVTFNSQLAIGEPHYSVDVTHSRETTQWQTILKAIDDDLPEITKIEAVPADWKGWGEVEEDRNKFYIVIGIKEYLLADIEVTELSLNNVSLLDQLGREGKPYDVFGKEFLKKRDAPFVDASGAPYKLKPGEFYVEAEMFPGVYTLRMRVRNPARKTAAKRYKFSRPNIGGISFYAGSFPWAIDVAPYDQDEDRDRDGIPGPDIVPESGTFGFTVAGRELNRIRVKSGVHVFKNKKAKNTVNRHTSGGDEQAEVEVNIPVPSHQIFPFVNGNYILSNGSQSFSDLSWDGSGNIGQGPRYPVFIKATLFSRNNIQGLTYTNWQDYSGWGDDIILGDPTFIQVSPVFDDRYELCLYGIEKLEREYKEKVKNMIDYKLHHNIDIYSWKRKLYINGASNKEIHQLLAERKWNVYKQLEKETKQLEKIKNSKIESLCLELAMNEQYENNILWSENMLKKLSFNIKGIRQKPFYFGLQEVIIPH